MKLLLRRSVSILILAALTLESASVQALAAFPSTRPYSHAADAGYPDFETQAITPKVQSGKGPMAPTGFWKLSEREPTVRYFHRPGPTLENAVKIVKWIPALHSRLQKRISSFLALHDEVSQRTGPKLESKDSGDDAATDSDEPIKKSLKDEWEQQLEAIARVPVEIVYDHQAESTLGTLVNPANQQPYVPTALSRIGVPDSEVGQSFIPQQILLKESIFHISNIPRRAKFLGIVLGHAKAGIWIITNDQKVIVRALLQLTRVLGAKTMDEQIEKAAKGLTIYFYWRMRKQLNRIVKTPPIQLSTLISLYRRHNEYTAESPELRLLRCAYAVAEKSYRPDNKDKVYPSGESYSSKTTRDARDLIRQGADAITIAAALLQEVPTSELKDLREKLLNETSFDVFDWLDSIDPKLNSTESKPVEKIIGLIQSLKRIQMQPNNLYLPKEKDRPNYAIQDQSQYEIQFIQRVAEEYRVPYDSLLLFNWVSYSNLLPTIDPVTQNELLEQTCSHIELVLAPLAERHGRGPLARELGNAVRKYENPKLYEETRAKFRKRLGMTHEQAQKQVAVIAQRLDDVIKNKYAIVVSDLPWGTSPLGRDNPNGGEKWYGSALQKDIGDTPIEDQKDLIRWMVVVRTPEDLERLRHSLDEDIGSEELLTERVGQRTRAIRGPDGRIAYQLSNFQFENPYDPTHTVVAELQIMTEEYHHKHYISGVSPAAYRYPHWWLEAKRDADIKAFGKHTVSHSQGQQFNFVDPLLSGNRAEDSKNIAENLSGDVYVKVSRSSIKLNGPVSNKDLQTVQWEPIHLQHHPHGMDVMFHPTVGGNLDKRPKLRRLTPKPSAQQPKGEILYDSEPIGLWDAIKPGDVIVVDQELDSTPLEDIAVNDLLSHATSPWAQLVLRRVSHGGAGSHTDLRIRPLLIAEGRLGMLKGLEGTEWLNYENAVIKPLAASMHFYDLGDFYVARALAMHDRAVGQTILNSPLMQLEEDYNVLFKRQFVQFQASAEALNGGDVLMTIRFDEDQIGVLTDCIHILGRYNTNVISWEQQPSTTGGGVLHLRLTRTFKAPLQSEQLKRLEIAIQAGLFRRRGKRQPPEDGRRLQVNFAVAPNAGPIALEQFADAMQRHKIDIEDGHQEAPQEPLKSSIYSCTLLVPRIEEGGQELDAVTMVQEAMNDLAAENIISDLIIHDAPMTDSTREQLLSILREERSLLPPGFEKEFPTERQTPLPNNFKFVEMPGPIDDGLVSDFHRALKIAYRYLGHPKAGDVWAKLQSRRTGAPFVSHAEATTYSLLLESRQRHTRTILRQLLHTAVREGPENVWRLVSENILPDLAARTAEGTASGKQRDAILRRLKKRFPTIDAPMWISAAQSQANHSEDSLLSSLHQDVLKLAQQEIENQIVFSFPMYGQELIRTIRNLGVSPLEMLKDSTVPRQAAKMVECEHDLKTHEDIAQKVPKTLYEFLPLIMQNPKEILSEEDREEYIFSRRHLLHTLILETNKLEALVPNPEPGTSLSVYYQDLSETVSRFLAFMSDPANQLLFDHLVDSDQMDDFRRRLQELVRVMDASYQQMQAFSTSPPTPPGLDPGLAAAFGPTREITEETAAALMRFLIEQAGALPQADWDVLPLQPGSREAAQWLSLDISAADTEFIHHFRTIWKIADDLSTNPDRSHRIAVVMELLLHVHLREADSLLASSALRLFENAFDQRDVTVLDSIRERLRRELSPAVAERLISNVQMVTRGDSQSNANFEVLKRYGSSGLKAAKAMDLGVDLRRRQEGDPAWVNALRFLNVLTPERGSEPGVTLWTIRRYITLMATLRPQSRYSATVLGPSREIIAKGVQDILLSTQEFAQWAITDQAAAFLPHELGDVLPGFLQKLTTIQIKAGRSNWKRPPEPPPGRPSMLKKDEWSNGLKRATISAYAAALISILIAIHMNHFSTHIPSLGMQVIADGLLFTLPALLAILAWGTGIVIHEWLGHIREARKTHWAVKLVSHFGHWIVVGIPKSHNGEGISPNKLPFVDDKDVLEAGPRASKIAMRIGIGLSVIAAIAFYLHVTPPHVGRLYQADLIALAIRWALLTFTISTTAVNAIFALADRTPIVIPSFELGDNLESQSLTIKAADNIEAASLLSYILSALTSKYEIGRRLSIQRAANGEATLTVSVVRSGSLAQSSQFQRDLDDAKFAFAQAQVQPAPPSLLPSLHRRRLWVHLTHPADLAKVIDRLLLEGLSIESIQPTLYNGDSYYVFELMGPVHDTGPLYTEWLLKQLAEWRRWNIRDVRIEDYVAPDVAVLPEKSEGGTSQNFDIIVHDRYQQPRTLAKITGALVSNGCFILEYDQQLNPDTGISTIAFKVRQHSGIRRESLNQDPNLKKIEVYPSRNLSQGKTRSLNINFYLQDQPGAFDQIASALAEMNVQIERGHQDTYVSGKSQRMMELRVSISVPEIETLKSKLTALTYTNYEDGETSDYPLISHLEIAADKISESDAAMAANLILKQIENASSGDKTVAPPYSLTPAAFRHLNYEFIHNIKKGLDILNLANADPDTIDRPQKWLRWLPAWLVKLIKRFFLPEWYIGWLTPDWLPTTPQMRKANNEPYVLHPKRTAYNLLARGVRNRFIIIDALLHDAIEDAGKNVWGALEEALILAADPENRKNPGIRRKQRELMARFRRYFVQIDDNERNLMPEIEALFDIFNRLPASAEKRSPEESSAAWLAKLAKRLDENASIGPQDEGAQQFSKRLNDLKKATISETKQLVKDRVVRDIRSYPSVLIHHIGILSNDDDYEQYAKDLIERGLSDLLLIKFEEQRDNLRSIWDIKEKSPSFPSKSIAKNIRYIAPIAFSSKYEKQETDKSVLAAYFEVLIKQSCQKDETGAYELTSLPVYYERNKTSGSTESVETSRTKMIESMRIIQDGLKEVKNGDFLPKDISPEDLQHFISLLESTPLDAPSETAQRTGQTPSSDKPASGATTAAGEGTATKPSTPLRGPMMFLDRWWASFTMHVQQHRALLRMAISA